MVCSGRVWCVVDLFVMLCCLTDLGACVVGLLQFCLCLASWIVLARVLMVLVCMGYTLRLLWVGLVGFCCLLYLWLLCCLIVLRIVFLRWWF